MSFVYIFEDGQVGVSEEEPTALDLASIGNGVLQVLQTSGHVAEVNQDGSMMPLRDVKTHRSTIMTYKGRCVKDKVNMYHYLEMS